MVLGMGLAVACCRGSSLQSPNKPGTTALRVRLFLAKLQAMYVSYAPRWLCPSGHIFQDEDLVKRSDPVRRQLLGAMGDLSDPLGNSPDAAPDSQYWFTHDWNSVPLKEWAESCAGDPPYDWGTGYGVSETKFLPGFEFPDAIDPRK